MCGANKKIKRAADPKRAGAGREDCAAIQKAGGSVKRTKAWCYIRGYTGMSFPNRKNIIHS